MAEEDQTETAQVVAKLAALPSLLVGTEEMDRLVWQTALLGVSALDMVDACGVTVLREGAPTSIMPDIATYADLEQLQYETDDGPAVRAVQRRQPVLIEQMSTETRFGEYPKHAVQRGVAASLSLPMQSGTDTLGAMTLYSTKPHDFADGRDLADLVVELATTALSLMLRHAEKTELAEQLATALDSRSIIDQAKGMVMMQRGCTADEAFEVLRRVSQNRNIKLRDVASTMVAALGRQRQASEQ
jgi:GAF domain-containing protein